MRSTNTALEGDSSGALHHHVTTDSDTSHPNEVDEEKAEAANTKIEQAPPGPPPLYLPKEAYLTVVGGWIALFCSFGFLNAFGVFQAYYSTSGVIPPTSTSTISWIGSVQSFFILSAALVAGPLQDKYGPKPLMLAFALCFSLSCMMVSLCSEWWQLFLAQGVFQGIALSLGFTPPMACVILWFKHKSPIAVAVIVSGSSVGGVLWPIIVNALLNHAGFGWTWRAIGFIGLGLLLLTTHLVSVPSLNRIPSDEKSFTDDRGVIARYMIKPAHERPPPRPFFYWNAFKIRTFTCYLVAFWFLYLGFFFTFFYLPSWGLLYGLSENMSFYSLSILNAASFFGRLFLPFASFKLGPFNVLLICSIISTLLVYCELAVTSSVGVLVLGGFYGFWSGGLISMMAPCAASLIPDKSRIGGAVGILTGICSISALISTPICGWIIAAPASPFKGYNGAQGFSAAALTIASILFFANKLMLNRNPFGRA
ncbi:hypothetical protein CBS101457_002966 [Exobasidium rhododendri]|nr:hypothetical protein CBS101457_002966 [Exobasidium rhododendri]